MERKVDGYRRPPPKMPNRPVRSPPSGFVRMERKVDSYRRPPFGIFPAPIRLVRMERKVDGYRRPPFGIFPAPIRLRPDGAKG